MPRFSYTVLDARGQEAAGVLDAPTQSEAVSQLRQAGYFPTSVAEEGKAPKARAAKAAKTKAPAKAKPAPGAKKGFGSIARFQRRTVKSKTLMIFTRQLATLIDAGLPLLRGLNVLSKQERDPVLRGAVERIADSVQGGSTFSEGLAQHPRVFNKLFVSMVKAGEAGGVLELVLQRLAEFQEKAAKVRNKVKSAMFYPIAVMVIAVLIVSYLMVAIVPKFQQIFKDMLNGKPLPALTQWVIEVSEFVQAYYVWVAAGVALIVVGWKAWARTAGGRRVIDKLKLRLPIFGDLTRKSAIARFTRTLGTLVTSGVPILQALTITSETADNALVSEAITRVHDSVKEGESIVAPMEGSGIFPPMVLSMVDVGEETGQLPDMLLKIAEVYDDEVDNSVAGLTSLLEPLMIIFLAVVVGTIVIALFLPLVTIIQEMSGGQG